MYTFELENIYLYLEASEPQPLKLKYIWIFSWISVLYNIDYEVRSVLCHTLFSRCDA